MDSEKLLILSEITTKEQAAVIQNLKNLILEMFIGATIQPDGLYDHFHTPHLKKAQGLLIDWEMIDPKDCKRL